MERAEADVAVAARERGGVHEEGAESITEGNGVAGGVKDLALGRDFVMSPSVVDVTGEEVKSHMGEDGGQKSEEVVPTLIRV